MRPVSLDGSARQNATAGTSWESRAVLLNANSALRVSMRCDLSRPGSYSSTGHSGTPHSSHRISARFNKLKIRSIEGNSWPVMGH